VKVEEALKDLRAQRKSLNEPDDADLPTDLLDALVRARDAALNVDLMTDAKKHAFRAIDNMQTGRCQADVRDRGHGRTGGA
jgi:hypothetical protein